MTKLSADGTAPVYSTYLGGSFDEGCAIAVDDAGNAYVTGFAGSDFPTTPGAFQTTLGSSSDAFVTKLNADGTALVYSTYLGGNSTDWGFGIAVDGAGNAYVTGLTQSTDFPTTPGAFQTTHGGGLFDAFVTKLNAAGTALVYSTYLGGSENDEGLGIAVDGAGNAYVTGFTQSIDFPTTPGAFQTTRQGGQNAFVAKIGLTEPGGMAVLNGKGDSFFQPPTYYDVSRYPNGPATGDFNGDGAKDLAVTVYSGSVAVLINRGNGAGPLAPPPGSASPRTPAVHNVPVAGLLVVAGDRMGATGSTSLPLGSTLTGFPPSPGAVARALDAQQVDRLFAAVSHEDRRSAVPRLPHPARTAFDDRLAWEVGGEGWLAEVNFADGLAGWGLADPTWD